MEQRRDFREGTDNTHRQNQGSRQTLGKRRYWEYHVMLSARESPNEYPNKRQKLDNGKWAEINSNESGNNRQLSTESDRFGVKEGTISMDWEGDGEASELPSPVEIKKEPWDKLVADAKGLYNDIEKIISNFDDDCNKREMHEGRIMIDGRSLYKLTEAFDAKFQTHYAEIQEIDRWSWSSHINEVTTRFYSQRGDLGLKESIENIRSSFSKNNKLGFLWTENENVIEGIKTNINWIKVQLGHAIKELESGLEEKDE